jgi:hypothetical protein
MLYLWQLFTSCGKTDIMLALWLRWCPSNPTGGTWGVECPRIVYTDLHGLICKTNLLVSKHGHDFLPLRHAR